MKRFHKKHRYFFKNLCPKFGDVQTGVGGVLYPPHSLKTEMIDCKIFREMDPTVDDIWFWAAAVENGSKIAPVPFAVNFPGTGRVNFGVITISRSRRRDPIRCLGGRKRCEWPRAVSPGAIRPPRFSENPKCGH